MIFVNLFVDVIFCPESIWSQIPWNTEQSRQELNHCCILPIRI